MEMLAVTEKSVSQLYREITEKYGKLYYEDTSFTMRPERKEELKDVLFVQKQLPDFGAEIDHVSREDGCKVYFTDGSWVICRFSGTEPLLRVRPRPRATSRPGARPWACKFTTTIFQDDLLLRFPRKGASALPQMHPFFLEKDVIGFISKVS